MASPDRWELPVLEAGRCEPLKAGVHGVLLATMAVCAAYNGAAWLRRRQRHLAINAIIYSAAVYWESCHVAHHLTACPKATAHAPSEPPAEDLSPAA